MTAADEVADVLDERPDLEIPLQEVLAVDEDHQRWTFDDVPVDSGPFGELVNRDIVEHAEDEYRLADPAAVRRALSDGDASNDSSPSNAPSEGATLSRILPGIGRTAGIDRTTALLVGAAVLFVGLVRAIPVGSIYRDGTVVLSGNDPYYYRHLVEEAITGGFPERALDGEPLVVATLTIASEVFGGSITAASHVMVWYPVVAAMVGALLVYLLAVTVTDDRRIALAAVLFFALVPDHAIRTSVGFTDHHAFDYVWLTLTALAATKLATVDREALRDRRTWALVAVAGLAIAAQILAWEASPILLVPLPILVAVRALVDLERDVSPLPAGVPLVSALALGTAIALFVHVATGMQSTVVAAAPVALGLGAACTLALATVGHRRNWQTSSLLVSYGGLALVGVVGLINGPAALQTELLGRLGDLFRSDAIFETQGLLDLDPLAILLQFGIVLLLALPAMVLALGRSRTDGRWLAVSTYAWYFLALSMLQIRFVGELAAFAAIFAGCGVVWLAARLDVLAVADRERDIHIPLRVPSRRTVAKLFVLVALLGGLGAVQSVDMMDRLAVEDRVVDSANAIDDYASDRDRTYPENYVLSDWSDNRVYNYVVSGQSLSYVYAQDNYTRFAGGTDPDSWYEEFEDRVGYVVLAPASNGVNPRSAIWRLTREYGSASGDVPGVAHYRPLYVPPDRGRVVVEVVPGATLTGTGDPGANVTVSTVVDRPTVEFAYERHTSVAQNGTWQVTVANPGQYDVSVGNQSHTVDVSETAVVDGAEVSG